MKRVTVLILLVTAVALAAGDDWSSSAGPGVQVARQPVQAPNPEEGIIHRDVWSGEPEPGEPDWGSDVQVYHYDSVVEVRLDWHESDNIICFLRYLGNGRHTNILSLNSTDGLSWNRGTNSMSTSSIPAFDIACCSTHVYEVACLTALPNYIKMHRYKGHDARMDTFPDGEWSLVIDTFPSSVSVVDIAIVSNRYYTDDMLFIGAITDDNRMHFYRVGINNFIVYPIGPGEYPANATGGLDMCWNEGFTTASYPLLFTYIATTGRIACYGFTYSGADTHMFAVSSPTNGGYTSLSAWKDTFLFTYDFASTDGIQARYLTSYNRGASWFWGVFGDTTTPTVRSAAVTARNGYGQAVSFWQYPQSTDGISFTHRPYRGAWSEPARIQDYSSYSNRLSDIEHIGDGAYGIVYVRSTRNGVAYFDRSDWTGIQEPVPIGVKKPRDTRTTIVHGSIRLPGNRKAALLDATGRRVAELHPGQNDIRHVSPGLYFLRSADSGKRSAVTKVLIAR